MMYTAFSMVITGELVVETDGVGALVEQLGISASGDTRDAACKVLGDLIREHAGDYGLATGWKVAVTHDGERTLHVTSNDVSRMLALLLKRARIWADLSLADVTLETGAKSRNGWAQYEQGRSEPSISKLQAMLDVVAPELVVAVIPRNARVHPRWAEALADDAELNALIDDPSSKNLESLVAKRAVQATKRKVAR